MNAMDRFQEVKITGKTASRKAVEELEKVGLSKIVKALPITRPMVEVVTYDANWQPVIILVEKF
jgi:hypothetical protein